MNFYGLFEINDEKIVNYVKLCEFDEKIIKPNMDLEDYNRKKKPELQQPYLQKFQPTMNNNYYYIIVMKPETTKNIYEALKGIEEQLKEHLSDNLINNEWKQRAIKILIYWNLSEIKELQDLENNAQNSENSFKIYSIIFLGLGLLSLIIMHSIKFII